VTRYGLRDTNGDPAKPHGGKLNLICFRAHSRRTYRLERYFGAWRKLVSFYPSYLPWWAVRPPHPQIGQVREVAPGTYAIAVASNVSLKKTLFQSHEGTDEAVSQAGQFCHAKGQKLIIMPGGGKDITFQCGAKITPGE
jgi:hypothetical protein